MNAGDFPLVHSGHAISTVYDMELPGSQPNAHDRFRVKGASYRGLSAALLRRGWQLKIEESVLTNTDLIDHNRGKI